MIGMTVFECNNGYDGIWVENHGRGPFTLKIGMSGVYSFIKEGTVQEIMNALNGKLIDFEINKEEEE